MLAPAGLGGRYALLNWPWLVEAVRSALTGEHGALAHVSVPVPLPAPAMPGTAAERLYLTYAAGAALLLLRYLAMYIRLRRALRRGRPADGAPVRAVAEKYGLSVCPAVEAEGLPSAFICGVLRPVLALPTAGEGADEKVLLHELLRLKYHDAAWGLVICAFRCLHWCNPLLWYCANLAGNDLESLCGQRVLERLEGEDRRAQSRGSWPPESEWDDGLAEEVYTMGGYHIYNLAPAGEDAYEGLLVVELLDPPEGEEWDGTVHSRWLAAQRLRAEKEGDRWVVRPLEDLHPVRGDERAFGNLGLPGRVYEARFGDFTVRMFYKSPQLKRSKYFFSTAVTIQRPLPRCLGADLNGLFPPLDLLAAAQMYFQFQFLTDLAALCPEGGGLGRAMLRWRAAQAVLVTVIAFVPYLPSWLPEGAANGVLLVLAAVYCVLGLCLTAAVFSLRSRFKKLYS